MHGQQNIKKTSDFIEKAVDLVWFTKIFVDYLVSQLYLICGLCCGVNFQGFHTVLGHQFVCLFLAPQPPVGHGLIIYEVFRSHTTTLHSL